MNALQALLQIQSELAGIPDEVPTGWMTTVQWAEATGKGETTVRRSLKQGALRGIVDVKKFRALAPSGRLVEAQYYRVIEKKGKR